MKTNFYMYNEAFNQLATNNLYDKDGNICNLYGEIFVEVIFNNIHLPKYLISNFGRFYNYERKTFPKICSDKDGYLRCNLNINGQTKTAKIHRIVLMSFAPIHNPQDMVVNHKDGDKTNNTLENLEWTTIIENTRHGWSMGLNNNIGENHPLNKYTDEQIHYFCRLIDDGLTNSQICDISNIFDKSERMRVSALLSSIKSGKTHINISSQYNFLKGIHKINYGEFYAYIICQFLSDTTREYTYKEIADYMQVPYNERVQFANFINCLLLGDTYLNVTRQFSNLKRPLKQKKCYNEYLY